MSVHVQLEQFEGPLGLLLYLIRKEEMDIKNIQIHKITRQYLDYIRVIRDFDLEVAGEFVAMAATLIHIKSRMLLPHYNEEGEVVETEDPRKELVQRLLEYQKFQEASKLLYARPLLGRDTFARGIAEEYEEGVEEIILDEGGLYTMIALYRASMKKLKKRVHTVYAKGQSIASRIMEIKDRFVPGRRMELREVLESDYTRSQLLITFLSVLELARLGFISIFQSDVYGDLYIDTQRSVERDVVVRVQEYETKAADQVAESWIQLAAKESAMERVEAEETEGAEVPAEVDSQLHLIPQESEFLGASTSLQDGGFDEVSFLSDAASDDDILAAEREMFGDGAREPLEIDAAPEIAMEAVPAPVQPAHSEPITEPDVELSQADELPNTRPEAQPNTIPEAQPNTIPETFIEEHMEDTAPVEPSVDLNLNPAIENDQSI